MEMSQTIQSPHESLIGSLKANGLSRFPSLAEIRAEIRRRKELGFAAFFRDTGPLNRHLYPKHLDFFKAGATSRERAIIGSNRSGKTHSSAYEVVLHATGKYPSWWEGKRFFHGVKIWAAGDTSKTVRDIIQYKLLGTPGDYGTGMIPKKDLIHVSSKQGLPDAVEIIKIAHVSGDTSTIILKSYDQKREAFQGTEMDLIWLDEEPPEDIYTECLLRTMTTNGSIMLSFTPLMGWTQVVNSYLKEDENNTKWFITIPWDDAPHLTDAQKKELLNSIPLHQRDARTKGIPSIGSGQIYPFREEDIVYDDFQIPAHWPRAYGMDVGWNWTAAVWIAKDRDTDTIYLYNCYKVGETKPPIHAQSIKARGEWMKGVIDYAGTDQSDGTRIMSMYQGLGLNVIPANKTVEIGLFTVEQRLANGTLKVARSCREWFNEQLLYRRNEKGHIVKEHDHLMDATRYVILKHEEVLSTGIKRDTNHFKDQFAHINQFAKDNWMS